MVDLFINTYMGIRYSQHGHGCNMKGKPSSIRKIPHGRTIYFHMGGAQVAAVWTSSVPSEEAPAPHTGGIRLVCSPVRTPQAPLFCRNNADGQKEKKQRGVQEERVGHAQQEGEHKERQEV